jgi:RimJ/RimL family protein N-acetyltransferase
VDPFTTINKGTLPWLTLRGLCPLDATDYHKVLALPEVVRFDDFDTITYEEAVNDCAAAAKLYAGDPDPDPKAEYTLAIDLHKEGRVVTPGFLYFTTMVTHGVRSMMIGYHLHPEHQGQGIARTAVGSLVDTALERRVRPKDRFQKAYHEYDHVFALVYQGNTRSIHLLERLGFSRDTRYEAVRDVRGTPMVEHRYTKQRFKL